MSELTAPPRGVALNAALSVRAVWVFGMALGATIILAVASFPSFRADFPSLAVPEVHSIDACVSQSLARSANMDPWDEKIRQLKYSCYEEGLYQATLNEFQIRRIMLLTQVYEERIALWIVVWMTTFGVVFAALQLAIASHLNLAGRLSQAEPTELALERGRIVFRSSALGISVLGMSLAFFVVFAMMMYPRQEMSSRAQPGQSGSTAQVPANAAPNGEPEGKLMRTPPQATSPDTAKIDH